MCDCIKNRRTQLAYHLGSFEDAEVYAALLAKLSIITQRQLALSAYTTDSNISLMKSRKAHITPMVAKALGYEMKVVYIKISEGKEDVRNGTSTASTSSTILHADSQSSSIPLKGVL